MANDTPFPLIVNPPAEYQAHPAANLFPMMNGDELRALAEDIREHGQLVPIIVHDGSILDGRNRYQACRLAGVAPLIESWRGSGSPTPWVISMNLQRRHLTPSQRAAVAVDVLPLLESEAHDRKLATLKRGELTPVPPNLAERGESREAAADLFNVGRQYISDAKRIKQDAPDLYEDLRSGAKTITDAKREMKERARETTRQQNRLLVDSTPPVIALSRPSDRFQAIVIDPPWDWGDEGDADQFGRARPTYDTMPLEDIAALPLADLSDRNAHVYLWITNRSLPKGFALLEAWGFRYVTMLTWVKPSIGMGNYYRGTTEHVLFGVRGSLPLLRRDVGTHFAAARTGRHSGKPEAFYELVESCSPGPWLEMFSRSPRPGWTAWGAEATDAA